MLAYESSAPPNKPRKKPPEVAKLPDEFAAQAVTTVTLPGAGMSVLDQLAKLRLFK